MILSKLFSKNSEVRLHISPRIMKEILRIEREMEEVVSKKYEWSDGDEI